MLETRLLLLGLIAGFTIFIGLPLVVFFGDSDKRKGFLSAIASGILLFILIEILSDSAEPIAHAGSAFGLAEYSALYLIGFTVGVFSLVLYEDRVLQKTKEKPIEYSMATMTAYGIGLHNFGEGLAIGAAFASGALGLAAMLVIGFGAHNTTEGFAVFSPLKKNQMTNKRIIGLGLVGGGPTLLGTIVGGFFDSTPLTTLLYALAGGSVLYVLITVLNGVLNRWGKKVGFAGLLVGFTLGFLTDALIVFASGGAL
ncbi:MAG: ZIP family metal transporter [Thermoprotei archaeon]